MPSEKDFKAFEKSASISFHNPKFLRQAFTHRSFLNENPQRGLEHNERLEYLGDAVLELIVSEFLYAKFPEKPEGELTSLRAALVNTNSISDCATELGINDYLLLSRGEAKDTGRARQYILANAYEALIGAIYLDQGYASAKKFIGKTLLHKVETIVRHNLWQDAKSLLQERAQDELSVTPSYKTLKETGPDHAKRFTVGVYFGDELVVRGEGLSKQEAEQAAAQVALKKKGWN